MVCLFWGRGGGGGGGGEGSIFKDEPEGDGRVLMVKGQRKGVT